jgi:hypothetical protein
MNKIYEIALMLQTRRPAFSNTEEAFIEDYLEPLGVERDDYGNVIKRIGDNPKVMWSSHTDSVHKYDGYQAVKIKGQYAMLNDGGSNCLGADDVSGVWLMMEMIRAGKEGLYVFHRCEERGGKGSDYIATKTPELLQGIECVIALDRRGTRDVITHQSGGRCCSDLFGDSLAKAIGMKHKRCSGGVFTDSANYTDLVGECTNLSVGYEMEHSKNEKTDLAYLVNMSKALIALNYEELSYSRKPGEPDPEMYVWSNKNRKWGDRYYEYSDGYLDEQYARYCTDTIKVDEVKEEKKKEEVVVTEEAWTLEEYCYTYPDVVAEVLEDYGVTSENMAEEVFKQTGEYTL